MNWPAIFLGCFVIGFVFSALAFVSSAAGLHVHGHAHGGHFWHAPHGPAHGAHGGHAGPAQGLSAVNFGTVMAFLAWFGGTGYLLTSELRWLLVPALVLSTGAGTVGAAIVFWVMARLLWSPRENMLTADYQIVGSLGKVNQPIREGGIGEVLYVRGGARASCGARSANGQAIAKGEEVVVTSYERGIAYVQRLDDLAAEQQ
jgi:membrane protein implicated in regulation of membrane protease activity